MGIWKENIYQGVLSAFIMHYNGVQWIDATPANVASLSSHLYNVYATAANNIWVGGYEYALHYDGGKWNTYKVADSIIVGSISGNGKYLYANAYSPWGKNVQLLYLFYSNIFKLIDETTNQKRKFGGRLWAKTEELISFINGAVATNINANGTVDTLGWHRLFTTNTFFGEIYIQSRKNVFAVGVWNLIFHFNGTDWAIINIDVPNHTVDPFALFWGVWTDGNEVFISDTENGIVYMADN